MAHFWLDNHPKAFLTLKPWVRMNAIHSPFLMSLDMTVHKTVITWKVSANFELVAIATWNVRDKCHIYWIIPNNISLGLSSWLFKWFGLKHCYSYYPLTNIIVKAHPPLPRGRIRCWTDKKTSNSGHSITYQICTCWWTTSSWWKVPTMF